MTKLRFGFLQPSSNYTGTETAANLNSGNAKSVTVKAKWTLKTTIKNFDYTGNSQTYTIPYTGYYRLEVWGSEGGYGFSTFNQPGGKGGYSVGVINLSMSSTLYVYVGQKGGDYTTAGWNGGGTAHTYNNGSCGGGGGSTDISMQGTANSTTWNEEKHLYSRIIVAGGGGGGGENNGVDEGGGYGGGINGGASSASNPAGTQISGGGFGYGQTGNNSLCNDDCGAGGGGWYGGRVGKGGNQYPAEYDGPGSGGSGWIYTASTYSYWIANSTEGKSGKWKLNSSYYLTSAQTIAGNASMPNTAGTGNETGHSGNGYAKITWLGDTI